MTISGRLTSVALAVAVAAPLLLSACGKTVNQSIDDATITTRVKTALLNDQQIDATRIGVHTVDGVVTLSGTVRTPAEATRALEITREIPGVKDVKSTLRANPTPPS